MFTKMSPGFTVAGALVIGVSPVVVLTVTPATWFGPLMTTHCCVLPSL